MRIQHVIPASLRLQIRILKRYFQDWFNNDIARFATKKAEVVSLSHVLTLIQPIKQSPFYENKIHNIEQGCQAINDIIIYPNEIFSFWKCIKKPSKKNNYRIGRNLINGRLSKDYGGGLCQLSSIIYHLSLIAGLEIVERYNHTFDIYEEDERFTPLGADATVVYGYKDLRVKNPYEFSIAFQIKIVETNLICQLLSSEKIEPREIFFEKNIQSNGILVSAKYLKNEEKLTIAKSFYK